MTHIQPQGFLSEPAAGTGPGVLVLHAWWGLNGTIKTFCRQLADAGFVAFAPDLYHGKVAETIPEAEVMRDALEGKQAGADLAAALQFLRERAATGDLAVIGFSLGAYFALDLSTRAPEQIKAVVTFYGTGPNDFSQSQAAYLGHFAENDPFEPVESVAVLEQALKSAGRPATFYTYKGTGHWFCEPDRTDAYNPAAANLAWQRTLAFLQRPSEQ